MIPSGATGVTLAWDFDNDGVADKTTLGATPVSQTFTKLGKTVVTLAASADGGLSSTYSATLRVHPSVVYVTPGSTIGAYP